jgi:hypothetical protein
VWVSGLVWDLACTWEVWETDSTVEGSPVEGSLVDTSDSRDLVLGIRSEGMRVWDD